MNEQEQAGWPTWAGTPEKRAANVTYWQAHNARCRELNQAKYGNADSAQLVIYVKFFGFEYRAPLPIYRRRAA